MKTSGGRAGLARIGACSAVLVAISVGIPVAVTGTGIAGTVGPVELSAFQAVDGKRVYETVCGACHQADGSGVQGLFPPLAGSSWVQGDEVRLIRVILHGLMGEIEVGGVTYSGMMPPFGSLRDPEVAAVATYVRGAWGNEAAAVTTATVARIRAADAQRRTPWTSAELE
jgi:mono/diheme cytochrome c family protein